MDYPTLRRSVQEDAALRRRQRLQPTGGQGDVIFPPTYPGENQRDPPRHVLERRRIDGAEAQCALVDSVQSQANRLEEALAVALKEGLELPHVAVDFRNSGITGFDRITSLEAPHRVFDAILRDSLLDGTPFPDSPVGRGLTEAKPGDATALLEASPTALLFGVWNSTGEGGGLGAKFPRCLVSELVAVNVCVDETVNPRTGEIEVRTAGRRSGSRIDPLGVLRKVAVYKRDDGGWEVDRAKAGSKAKEVRPSEINHGNIAPSIAKLGVTCDHVQHTLVITLAGLRRLGFGGGEKDLAGRTLLAALGLLAVAEQDARGYALRSRCDLVCEGTAPLERVRFDGSTEAFSLDREGARSLYREALDAARRAGFRLPGQPIVLTPQPKLVDIVKQSQRYALAGQGGEADAGA
jgi:CRISPR-associated protein Csb1